jgi:hypothetical protein
MQYKSLEPYNSLGQWQSTEKYYKIMIVVAIQIFMFVKVKELSLYLVM